MCVFNREQDQNQDILENENLLATFTWPELQFLWIPLLKEHLNTLSAARILQRLLAGAGCFLHVCSLVPGAFRVYA